jgi:hypothetical protein
VTRIRVRFHGALHNATGRWEYDLRLGESLPAADVITLLNHLFPRLGFRTHWGRWSSGQVLRQGLSVEPADDVGDDDILDICLDAATERSRRDFR